MIGRFLTEVEKRYQKKFPKDGTLPYYFQSEDNSFENMLEVAIKRNSAVTKQEIIDILGGEDNYKMMRAYLIENGYTDAK